MSEFKGFIVAAQIGGPFTGVDDEIPCIKRAVESRMKLTRAEGVESVHMAFLVDGRFATYGAAKAERLKMMRKKAEAWIDLGVPVSAYEGRTREEVRLYLCECVEAALDLLVARFRKDKVCDGCELLYGDWAKAKAEYLTSP